MAAMTWPPGLVPWSAAALFILLTAAAAVDLKVGRIPNWLTYPAILIGLGLHALVGGIGLEPGKMGLTESLAGLAVGFVPLGLFWLAGGIGGGDAKLMAAIGALAGPGLTMASLFYGALIAAVMAIVVMVQKKLVVRTLRRVWHTLALLMAPKMRPADPTTADSPKIPFAVALCLGTAAAVLEALLRAGLNPHLG